MNPSDPPAAHRHPGSFRDPSGFLFDRSGELYRQVAASYAADYDLLKRSGLYEGLTDAGLLVRHDEVEDRTGLPDDTYKVLRPDRVPFISYPYEWCFSQLKTAALASLEIQKRSLKCGMSLKDCSAYNIQFQDGRPVFIDTLSFEQHREGTPWVAYRQFCQHFLAPLVLMSYTDVRLSQLLRTFIDGVPLDLASVLLPIRTRASLWLLVHIHLHARYQKRYAGTALRSEARVGPRSLLGLIDSLETAVKRLTWKPVGTAWADYYDDTNYSATAATHKEHLVREFLATAAPQTVWDLGANTGRFSHLSADNGALTIAFDSDPAAVEKHYLNCVEAGRERVLPLVLDLSNPSPGIGWAGRERSSMEDRGPADVALALALVHHLAIANNVPLPAISEFLSGLCRWLIIEFVPKEDSQVQRLLSSRVDIFADYTQPAFETGFRSDFVIEQSCKVNDSSRTLYLLRRQGT